MANETIQKEKAIPQELTSFIEDTLWYLKRIEGNISEVKRNADGVLIKFDSNRRYKVQVQTASKFES